MKILSVVGARPQFIKAAPVSRALREAGLQEIMVHTGQHYDYEMSQIFFEELNIPAPNVNLGVGSGPHGWQTGQMLIGLESQMLGEKPDRVLVYGDTNSTLAGALAACKLRIPVAHIEAGLRSFNRDMPEEHNRILTDHCADLLFCPTETAAVNLEKEGLVQGVHLVGDTMFDAVLQFTELARPWVLSELGLSPNGYLLATIHRPYNTDVPGNLREIVTAFLELDEPVVFPVHPRTKERIRALDLKVLEHSNVKMIEPVGYLEMLMLEQNARIILTDSGGMQKEAYFFATPCLTIRSETEWVETVEEGWNLVVGANRQAIVSGVKAHSWPESTPIGIFGDGHAAQQIVSRLVRER